MLSSSLKSFTCSSNENNFFKLSKSSFFIIENNFICLTRKLKWFGCYATVKFLFAFLLCYFASVLHGIFSLVSLFKSIKMKIIEIFFSLMTFINEFLPQATYQILQSVCECFQHPSNFL